MSLRCSVVVCSEIKSTNNSFDRMFETGEQRCMAKGAGEAYPPGPPMTMRRERLSYTRVSVDV